MRSAYHNGPTNIGKSSACAREPQHRMAEFETCVSSLGALRLLRYT